MNYKKQCWVLLVLGLVFGFILGGSINGVVHGDQSKKDAKTTTVKGKKFEYWECTDKVTNTDFVYAKLGGKELLIDLIDVDGKPKVKSPTSTCRISIVENTSWHYILEDEDTGVQYMISHDFNSYRIRTLENGEPYSSKKKGCISHED